MIGKTVTMIGGAVSGALVGTVAGMCLGVVRVYSGGARPEENWYQCIYNSAAEGAIYGALVNVIIIFLIF